MVFVPVALLLLLAGGAVVGLSVLSDDGPPSEPPVAPEPAPPPLPEPPTPPPVVTRPAPPPPPVPIPKPRPSPKPAPDRARLRMTAEQRARIDHDLDQPVEAPVLGDGGKAFVDAVQKKLVPGFLDCLEEAGDMLPDRPLVVVLSVNSEAGEVQIGRATPIGIARGDADMGRCVRQHLTNAKLSVPNARDVQRGAVFLRIRH